MSVHLADTSLEGINIAREHILDWAERKSGSKLSHDAWAFKDFESYIGGRNIHGLYIEGDDSNVWALRADDPDKTVAGRTWTTEVVIGSLANRLPRIGMRLICSTSEPVLDIMPHVPTFLFQIAASPGLISNGEKLTTDPQYISSEIDAEFLVEALLDSNRHLPVFVLTIPQGLDEPLIDANALTRACIGIAKVVVVPAKFTNVLIEQLGKKRSVFGGAVRAYLPGFRLDSNPYAHRLVLAEYIAEHNDNSRCSRWLRSLAASESVRRLTLGKDVLSFSEVRIASLGAVQKQLASEGASDAERLAAAMSQIDALNQQYQDAKNTLEYFDAEHKVAEERAEAAEEQARASTFRIQQLLEQFKGSDVPSESEELPDSWEKFVDWCDVRLAGLVVLHPRARHSLRNPEFDDAQTAAKCLLWLGTVARDRRLAGGEGSLADEYFMSGLKNSHCGSDQFDLIWQGQRYTCDWHIKNGGNTRKPERCLRIYYFWEPATQQMVIAEMPAHRDTDAS